MRIGIPRTTTLAELWENGNWIMPPARSEPQVRLQSFLSTLVISESQDEYEWWPNSRKSKKFSTGEIYNLIRDHKPIASWAREIRFSGGIPRHKFIAWLMVLRRCPKRDHLLQWGIQTDPSCLLCNALSESRDHLLFECSFSWIIWRKCSLKCNFQSSRNWDTILTHLPSPSGNCF